MIRRVLFVLLLLALWPRDAAAALMQSQDLRSLAFEADTVVRAKRVAKKQVDQYQAISTFQITRVYKGALKVGETFDDDIEIYSLTPFMSQAKPNLGGEMIMFLKDRKILSSGLRIFLDGKAQRFVQLNNPGGFSPVPQHREPADLKELPLDLPAMELEVGKAIARADEVTAALAHTETPEARRKLVELVGHAEDIAFETLEASQSTANEAIIGALAKADDLPSTLDAMSRDSALDMFMLRMPIKTTRFLDAAADTKLPSRLRVTAVQYLTRQSFDLRKIPDAEDRAIRLLADRDVAVRRMAIDIRVSEKVSPKTRDAITKRFDDETEDSVRVVLVRFAHYEHMTLVPKTPMPIIAAEVHGPALTVSWADVDPDKNWFHDSLTVTLHRPGKPDAKVDVAKRGSYSNGASGYFTGPVTEEQKPFTLDVDVTLDELNHKAKPVKRHFALTSTKAELPPEPEPSPAPSASASASAPAPASASPPLPSVTPPPATPRPRSCGCDAGAHDASGFLAFGMGLALFARRRTKRGRR